MTSDPPPLRQSAPLPYATPTTRQRGGVFSIPTLIALGFPLVLLTLLLGPVVRKFEIIFRDFGVQLPGATQFLLDLGRLFRAWLWVPLWTLAIILPFIVPLLLKQMESSRQRAVSWLLTLFAVLSSAILLIFAILCLYLPIITLVQSMSGK